MVEGHFRLTPEVGGALKSAIDQRTRAVFRAKWREGVRDSHAAYRADALAEFVLGEPGAKKPGGYTTNVLIDQAVLQRGVEPDAEGDADDRDERDERDEMVAALGAGIAQADVELVGSQWGEKKMVSGMIIAQASR